MISSGKPLLPSLAALLSGDKQTSEPCSPLFESTKTRFCSDDHGVIKLPPLGNSGIPRPRSVDSALRYTASLPQGLLGSYTPASKPPIRAHSLTEVDSPTIATPSTPVVKKKAASRKTDMLTPLSAARAIITPAVNEKKRAFAFITHSQETFPTKEPKIDNAPLARRKRRRTSTQELNILQAEFNHCPAPDKRKRQELAERCNMSEKAIQIWFQNKRQASKKQKNSAQKSSSPNAISDESAIHSTPLAQRSLKTSEARCNSMKDEESKENNMGSVSMASGGDITPTRITSLVNGKRGQALTFHLTSDKKILTPIKTSPNSRVNKLINGDRIVSPCDMKPRSAAGSPKLSTSIQVSPTRRNPLQEIKTNTLVH